MRRFRLTFSHVVQYVDFSSAAGQQLKQNESILSFPSSDTHLIKLAWLNYLINIPMSPIKQDRDSFSKIGWSLGMVTVPLQIWL